MYQKIILAYNGSLESQQALFNCKDLSQWGHAEVHLLSVVPYETLSMSNETTYFSDHHNKIEEERSLKILNDGVAQLKIAGIDATGKLLNGDAVDQIVTYAKSFEADLIMLGHKHGENWMERFWSGTIPKALIEQSPCSVLVVIIK